MKGRETLLSFLPMHKTCDNEETPHTTRAFLSELYWALISIHNNKKKGENKGDSMDGLDSG